MPRTTYLCFTSQDDDTWERWNVNASSPQQAAQAVTEDAELTEGSIVVLMGKYIEFEVYERKTPGVRVKK